MISHPLSLFGDKASIEIIDKRFLVRSFKGSSARPQSLWRNVFSVVSIVPSFVKYRKLGILKSYPLGSKTPGFFPVLT